MDGVGWFSLNVPSGLTIYWFINNILSTVQQVLAKPTLLFCAEQLFACW